MPHPNIPAYLLDWSGVGAVIHTDPQQFEQVIRLEFSHDGQRFDPVPLFGSLNVFVGRDVPEWGASMTVIWDIKAWRITYRDRAGKLQTVDHNMDGMKFNLAVAPCRKAA